MYEAFGQHIRTICEEGYDDALSLSFTIRCE